MINFSTSRASTPTVVETEVPVVQETITIKPRLRPVMQQTQVDWEELRDYVLAQVERIHGPQVRDERRENTIFMAFAARWPEQAMEIARYAFEGGENDTQGFWKGAPVLVARFHRTSDNYFAVPIAALLES
jgi:hypothetical protein